MHWEAVIERVRRCTLRPWSSECDDALWGRDRARLEMQLEIENEWTQRYTGRPWSSEFGHAPGSRDRVNSEMHSERRSSEFTDALAAGYDRGRWEEYLEVVDLEVVDGRHARCWNSIHRLVNSKPWECDEVTLPLKLLWELACGSRTVGRYAGSWSYIQGSTRNRENEGTTDNLRCMLYLVYAALGVCCTRC